MRTFFLQHRTKFRPNYYHRTPPEVAQLHPKASSSNISAHHLNSHSVETGEPDVKEVWFVGCHGGNSLSFVCHYDQRLMMTQMIYRCRRRFCNQRCRTLVIEHHSEVDGT